MIRVISATGNKICHVSDTIYDAYLKTIQWQVPAASFIYIMATNALFWITVFYTQWIFKFSSLCGLCVLLFITHVVYPFSLLGINAVKTPQKLREHDTLNSQQTSGAKVLALFRFFLLLPFKFVIFPACNIALWIINVKFVEYLVMFTSGITAFLLFQNKNEHACWMAYLTILFIYIVPPWRYNKLTEKFVDHSIVYYSSFSSAVNEKMIEPCLLWTNFAKNIAAYIFLCRWLPVLLRKINQCLFIMKTAFIKSAVEPIQKILGCLKLTFIYIFFGLWIPPLKNYIATKFWQFCAQINSTIVLPTRHFLRKLIEFLTYYFCGHWIPPLVQCIGQFLSRCALSFRTNVLDPLIAKILAIKRFLVYWFGGYWIPSFIDWCSNCKRRFYLAIIDPIVKFFSNFTENMIYILSGRWIPGAVDAFKTNVCYPVMNFTLICRDWLIFICFGHWIPIFLAFLSRKNGEFSGYVNQKLILPIKNYFLSLALLIKLFIFDCIYRFKKFLYFLYVRIKNKSISLKNRLILHVNLTILKIRLYFINQIWGPFKRKVRRFCFRLKLYTKYKIFYPALRNSILAVIYLCEWLCVGLLKPAFELFYKYIEICIQYFIVEYGSPFWLWFSKQLPEKSPFCDDSETELNDYLPDDEEPSHSDDEQTIRAHLDRRKSMIRDSKSSSSFEEDEFSRNLEIPAIDQADSDEEQELAMTPASSLSRAGAPKTRRSSTGPPKNPREDNKIGSAVSAGSAGLASQGAAALSTLMLLNTMSGGGDGAGAPTTGSSALKDLFSSAASFAVEQASNTATYLNSQVSKLISNEGGGDRNSSENRTSSTADLEPDFELIDDNDFDK